MSASALRNSIHDELCWAHAVLVWIIPVYSLLACMTKPYLTVNKEFFLFWTEVGKGVFLEKRPTESNAFRQCCVCVSEWVCSVASPQIWLGRRRLYKKVGHRAAAIFVVCSSLLRYFAWLGSGKSVWFGLSFIFVIGGWRLSSSGFSQGATPKAWITTCFFLHKGVQLQAGWHLNVQIHVSFVLTFPGTSLPKRWAKPNWWPRPCLMLTKQTCTNVDSPAHVDGHLSRCPICGWKSIFFITWVQKCLWMNETDVRFAASFDDAAWIEALLLLSTSGSNMII